MLFLCFQLGQDKYIVDARHVVEVLPLVTLRTTPQAPRGVAGAFIYRGTVVPVLDFGELARGQPCPRRFSTRILLLAYPLRDTRRTLGMIVERATETKDLKEQDFMESGLRTPGAPYLGPVLREEHRLIQSITVQNLVPESIRDLLFGA